MDSIKKIVIEIGGVELSLTPLEAKKLQAALNELFGPKVQMQYVPQVVKEYVPYPANPWHLTWTMTQTAEEKTAALKGLSYIRAINSLNPA